VDQAVLKLEKVGNRLSEIRKELQNAIRDKIDLSKSKIKELQLEVRTMIEEVESFGNLANA
jgi:Na+/phosphate symporter